MQTEIAGIINANLKKGESAFGVLDLIRSFKRPIAVDFNNVVANNSDPMQLNPDAPSFLQELGQIGDIFIVTSATSWSGVQRFLEDNGVWSQNLILMPSPSYEFISEFGSEKGKILRHEFLEMAIRLGWDYKKGELIASPRFKRVAPIFGKPWLIPIIDDLGEATQYNPGMLGIQVQEWEPNDDDYMKLITAQNNRNKLTLKDAVEIVRSHFSSIGLSSSNPEAVK